MDPVTEKHVVADRQRQRIGPLEHHADLLAHLHQFTGRVVDILIEDIDAAFDTHIAEALVDPVYTAQESGLSTAGRTDQRGDVVAADLEIDIEQRLKIAIPEVQVLRMDGVGLFLFRIHTLAFR